MNPSSASLRVHELIDAIQRDSFSESLRVELERLLLEDDDAVAAYVQRCQLEAALHFEIRSAAAARRVDQALAGFSARHDAPPHSGVSEVAQKRDRFRGLAPIMIAASLLIAAFAWLASDSVGVIVALRTPQPVASLESTQDAVWLGEDLTVGHRFLEGDSIYLTAGTARLSMASGAEVALRSPCFVSLDNDMLVRLEEGAVTAQVAEWAHGFTVSTDTLKVVDLGTKFAVSTDRGGTAEAHVLDGQVRVHSVSETLAGRHSLLLSGGEALRFQEQSQVTTKLTADRNRFDAELGDLAPFKPIPLYNTGRGLLPGDEDPHWRVVAGPKCPEYRGAQFAVVCEADSRYLSNEPDHSQWVSLANPVRPGVPNNIEFTFETRVDLTGYELRSVVISAQVIADNGIRAVRLNGEPVAIQAWTLNERDQVFNRFHVIEFSDGLAPGENVIQFDVWNGVDRINGLDRNPLALRVEWQAFGRPNEEGLAEIEVAKRKPRNNPPNS